MDYTKLENIEIEGIDHRDAPDYVDAFIAYAEYGGQPISDEELEEVNDDVSFVYECVMEHLY